MKTFELNDEQYARLMEACKPVPYLVIGGVLPRSPRENAEAVWRALGEELGFKWETARPIPGKGDRFFSADPAEAAEGEREE